jgi:hypothetical protein
MSSQPSGGPSIPAAAAVAGLDTDETQSDQAHDQGVPVGAADAQADVERGRDADDSDAGDDQADFVNADVDSETDQGVPVGRADAEQDRLRASSEDDSD